MTPQKTIIQARATTPRAARDRRHPVFYFTSHQPGSHPDFCPPGPARCWDLACRQLEECQPCPEFVALRRYRLSMVYWRGARSPR